MRMVSLHVPATADVTGIIRQAVDGLPLDLDSQAAFTLRLLVTDLISEVLRSGGDQAPHDVIHLSLRFLGERLRVEVRRRGDSGRSIALDLPRGETHGRGVLLVSALADSWGTRGGGADTAWLVWFELDLRR
jgi:two-component sensor histidine kinase